MCLRKRLWKGLPVEVVIVAVVDGVVRLRAYVVPAALTESSVVDEDRLECSGGRPGLLDEPVYAEPRASSLDEAVDVAVEDGDDESRPSRVLVTEPSRSRDRLVESEARDDDEALGSVDRSLDVEYLASTSSDVEPWRMGLAESELEGSRSLR